GAIDIFAQVADGVRRPELRFIQRRILCLLAYLGNGLDRALPIVGRRRFERRKARPRRLDLILVHSQGLRRDAIPRPGPEIAAVTDGARPPNRGCPEQHSGSSKSLSYLV